MIETDTSGFPGLPANEPWTNLLTQAPSPGDDQSHLAAQLLKSTAKSVGLTKAHHALIDSHEKEIDALRNRLTAEVENSLSAQRDSRGVSALSPQEEHVYREARMREVNNAVRRAQEEAIAKTDAARRDMIGQSAAADAHAQKVLDTLTATDGTDCARKYLSLIGLGTDQRKNYRNDVDGCGPAELTTHIKNALLQRNPVYGAAVLRVLENLKTNQRPIAPEEFAQQLVGEKYKQLVGAARMVRRNHKLMVEQNNNFVLRKKDSANSKIARGLEAEKQRLAEEREANRGRGAE